MDAAVIVRGDVGLVNLLAAIYGNLLFMFTPQGAQCVWVVLQDLSGSARAVAVASPVSFLIKAHMLTRL